MADLTSADFDTYFRDAHGHDPYTWQSRLTWQVLETGDWPRVIDLPTGTGKTAVLDTAIFSLALRPEVTPRRIVFVIDRRIVVDQVFERATRVKSRIESAASGVLLEVKHRLQQLSDGDEILGLAALRGGIPLDGEWARRPDIPWLLVSTVDQFGSRLLFRGYGASTKSRPILAGLTGNDCLVLLDEVHLSRAFAATLQEATSDDLFPGIQSVNPALLPRRFKVVEMSATPTAVDETPFRLENADLTQSPSLARIAQARKSATLVDVKGTKKAHESIPKKVLELVKKELHEHEKSVGVIVNRVRTARETHRLLEEKGIKAHLLTGRMRPLDKQETLDDIGESVDPDRRKPVMGGEGLFAELAADSDLSSNGSTSQEELTVVVATQAIEVGADFSFDALITEAAPIDSLCQRLGRLDRRGTLAAEVGSPARCWILGVARDLKKGASDDVYGTALRHTWELLEEIGGALPVPCGPSEELVQQLVAKAKNNIEKMRTQTELKWETLVPLAPTLEAPLVLKTHIEAWSQTNPTPIVDPDIADFLHGKESQQQPEVSIAWRWDASKEALDLVPLRPAEFLSVPVFAVRKWLTNLDEVPLSDTTSIGLEDGGSSKRKRSDDNGKREKWLQGYWRWVEEEEDPTKPIRRARDIKAGDRLVVSPIHGGLRAGTWDPTIIAKPTAEGVLGLVEDLGDQAQLAYASRTTLRLDPRLLSGLGLPDSLRLPLPKDEVEAAQTRRRLVDEWVMGVANLPVDAVPKWLRGIVERLIGNRGFDIETVRASDPDGYFVLIERSVDSGTLDTFDDKPSMTGAATTLRSHLAGVGLQAANFGRSLGLSEELVADLRLAGELHDLGKVDERFQMQMHGQDEVSLAASDEPLAKSLPGARTNSRKWPPVRHEISSVALVQSSGQILERTNDADLVLHLVASHHGWCRPLPPLKVDPNPQQLSVDGLLSDDGFRLTSNGETAQRADSATGTFVQLKQTTDLADTPLALEMADRFWRLQARYGHHGLAWLEAIFRLADQQQSAKERNNDNSE